MFGAIARGLGMGLSAIGRNSVSATRAVAKIPIVNTVAKQTALGAGVYALGNMLGGGGGSKASLPALPGGLPAIPNMGERSIFRDDPNVAEYLKQFAVSERFLKTYYRGPKGTVIVYDAAGKPFALPKKVAQFYKLWKPAHKPPISVGDFQALKRADRTAKKVKKILGMVTRVDSNVASGGRVVIRKKKGRK